MTTSTTPSLSIRGEKCHPWGTGGNRLPLLAAPQLEYHSIRQNTSPPRKIQGGLFLPPEHLQGGYVQQIDIFFIQAVDDSFQIFFHIAPPLGPQPIGMGYLFSAPYDNSIADKPAKRCRIKSQAGIFWVFFCWFPPPSRRLDTFRITSFQLSNSMTIIQ